MLAFMYIDLARRSLKRFDWLAGNCSHFNTTAVLPQNVPVSAIVSQYFKVKEPIRYTVLHPNFSPNSFIDYNNIQCCTNSNHTYIIHPILAFCSIIQTYETFSTQLLYLCAIITIHHSYPVWFLVIPASW